MSNVVIVNGSPNPASRLTGIVQHVEQHLRKKGVFGGLIHVSELPADDLLFGRYDSPAVQRAVSRIESADAVVFASPVYKASYSGLLKTFLDLLPQQSLAGKWVAPVFIGGTISHLLTVEYAFKPVAAALGARKFTPIVYAVDTQVTRTGENGDTVYVLQEELKGRLDQMILELYRDLGVLVHA